MASHVYVIYFVFITLIAYDVPSSASNNSSKYQYPPGSLICKTHNMTEMDCSNRNLVDIPFLHQNLTTMLDLRYNKLTDIKGAPFQQLPLLQTLDLSCNQIATLSHTAFRGIWFLEKLDLESNQIMALPEDIFFNLTKLESINLTDESFSNCTNECIRTPITPRANGLC